MEVKRGWIRVCVCAEREERKAKKKKQGRGHEAEGIRTRFPVVLSQSHSGDSDQTVHVDESDHTALRAELSDIEDMLQESVDLPDRRNDVLRLPCVIGFTEDREHQLSLLGGLDVSHDLAVDHRAHTGKGGEGRTSGMKDIERMRRKHSITSTTLRMNGSDDSFPLRNAGRKEGKGRAASRLTWR